MSISNTLFDSEMPVIFSYSRSEAIEDGVLINLSKNFPEECKLYKYPVACTAAVWDIVFRAFNNNRYLNDYAGLVWDILYMSINYVIDRPDPSTAIFQVNILGAGRKKLYTLKAVVGPGDNLEPVVTVMLPNED
jgi:hypothetical protein